MSEEERVYCELLEKRTCTLCGSPDYVVIYPSRYPKNLSLDDFKKAYCSSSDRSLLDQLVQCNSCGLQYLNPSPRQEIIYEGYHTAEDSVFVEQNAFRIKTFKRTLKKIIKIFQLPPKIKTLDVGCAGGAFLKAAGDLGLFPTGVEPSIWMCQFVKKTYGLEVYPGMLREQNFVSESFDMITFWDVLEHVSDPGLDLAETRRLLKRNGLLILTYPDIGSGLARILGKIWPFLLSVHLTYYTRDTISRQVKKAGFEPVWFSRYWQSLSLNYVLRRARVQLGVLGYPLALIEKLLSILRLKYLSCSYYMGQTLVVCKIAS